MKTYDKLMSSAEVAAQVFRQLETDDLRVLQVIETGMSKKKIRSKKNKSSTTPNYHLTK